MIKARPRLTKAAAPKLLPWSVANGASDAANGAAAGQSKSANGGKTSADRFHSAEGLERSLPALIARFRR